MAKAQTQPMRDHFSMELLAKLPAKRHRGRPSEEFIEKHDAHIILSDWHSCEAAIVTLERHGAELKEYNIVQDGPMLVFFGWFDADSKAIPFYNRLPNDMKRWYARNPGN